MYVVYHSSDSFAEVTGVSMLSLFDNNRDLASIHVLYIERGMCEENKERLKKIAAQYGRDLEFMHMPQWSQKLLINLKSCKDGWLGFGYNRLFLTEFIPEDVDRVLYLDSDTIIEGSLSALWNTELEDYYMAGVDDCLSSKYRKIVELDDKGVYCNAGMLLINMKKWRKDGIRDKFIEKIHKNNGYFVFNEQSLLNSLFAGKIKVLPQIYNVNTLVYCFEYNELMRLRKPKDFSYSMEEYYEARRNPVITHYTGNFYIKRRPWVSDSDHPHKNSFLYYRQLTPWKDEPLSMEDGGRKLGTEICHLLPKAMMICAVSLLYNFFRPKYYWFQKKKQRCIGDAYEKGNAHIWHTS